MIDFYEFACRKISTFQSPQQHESRKGYSYIHPTIHYSTIILPSPPLNSSKIAPITPQCSTRTPRRNGRPINLSILPPRNPRIRSILLLHPRTLQSQSWIFLSLHLAPLNVEFVEWRCGRARHGAVIPGRCGCCYYLITAVPVDEEGEGRDEREADDADTDSQPGFGAGGHAAVPAAGGVSWGGDGVLG
jgi:hypothetical protein